MYKYFFALLVALIVIGACKKDDDSDALTVSIQAASVDENDDDNTVNITVTASSSTDQDIVVILQTTSGSAMAGEDFEELSNYPLVITAGTTSASLPITIMGDRVLETDESFFIEILSVSNAEIAQQSTEIIILNDDTEFSEFIPDEGYQTPITYPDKTLIFSEEFEDGTDLTENWSYEIGNGQWGWGNGELQYYTAGDNVSLINGNLVIEARNEFFGGKQYTSTRMKTKGAFDFTYGRVDIRAALPKGQGLWPALWMLGTRHDEVGWPECGEIDIMEMLGQQPSKVYGTVHWKGDNGQQASYEGSTIINDGDFNSKFHVFSLEWTPEALTFYLDDEQYHTIGISAAQFDAFHHSFFLIMNVAVGGDWPGLPNPSTEFPQRMVVDYVRVFQ